MKKIIYIFLIALLTLILNSSFINAISYKEYKIGDTYTYNGMDFYVIQDSDTDSEIITTIKAEPLTVSEVNAYKSTNHINVNTDISRYTANNKNGYGEIAYYSDDNRCGYLYLDSVTPLSAHINNYSGCALKYEDSDIKHIVDAWVNDKIKAKDMMIDEYGNKYSLLTNEYLINGLGYKINSNGGYDKTANTPNFIYNSKYDYWIMHNYEFEDKISFNTSGKPLMINIDRSYIDSNGDVKEFDGNYSTSNVTMFDMHSIRPVVNFRKGAINSNNGGVKTFDTINFDIGDIVEYKGNKYYVISDNDSTITIIKSTPLTTAEVNKYGKGHINRYTSKSKNTAYDINGYGGVAYYSRRDCREGYTSGCNSSYNVSDIKYIIDAWLKDYTNSSDLVSNGSRLINSSDLLQIGYDFFGTSSGSSERGYSSLPQTSDFVLNLKDGWTSKSYNDSSTSVLTFAINGNLVSKSLYDYTSVIYPVITLKKEGYVSSNGNGYTIVSSPDTGANRVFVLEITGLIILLSGITLYSYVRIKRKY